MNENVDDSNIIVKHSTFVTNDSYLEDDIENKTENKDEKGDGDSNDINQKQCECDISSIEINKVKLNH